VVEATTAGRSATALSIQGEAHQVPDDHGGAIPTGSLPVDIVNIVYIMS
jgi:hypothetical protein